MRLKGRSAAERKKWRRIQEQCGYLPHYHRSGRLLVEVRFLLTARYFWRVISTATGEILEFRRNGTPLNGTRGRLVGPLVEKRKVKNAP